MAEEQEASNEGDSIPEYEEAGEIEHSTQIPPAIPDEAQGTTTTSLDDYPDEDENLPDVTINLYINDGPGDVTAPADMSQAILTDIYGNSVTQSAVIDYTTTLTDSVYTELITNGTETGGKGLFGKFIWFKISCNYKQTKEERTNRRLFTRCLRACESTSKSKQEKITRN